MLMVHGHSERSNVYLIRTYQNPLQAMTLSKEILILFILGFPSGLGELNYVATLGVVKKIRT
jgi:hypothetical protein